jgi:hypothetical protein
MALMNVITFKSYYVNIILFNILFLFGLVALFKVFDALFPGKKLLLIATIFLLPSMLFWCSGIHKDGLILSATGLVVYCFCKRINERVKLKHVVLIALCLLLVFSLRNYVVFALLPALWCWYISKKTARPISVFAVIYALGIAAFFIVPFLIPALNFPLFLANKQNEFLQLQGTSAVTSVTLQPTFRSYLSYLPEALDMAFLRPHVTEIKNLSYLPAIIENVLLLIVILLSLFFQDKKQRLTPILLFFVFFSISILIIAGYTITLSGAIVRYRSFVLPLLITPLLCMIDINRMKKVINF